MYQLISICSLVGVGYFLRLQKAQSKTVLSTSVVQTQRLSTHSTTQWRMCHAPNLSPVLQQRGSTVAYNLRALNSAHRGAHA